MKPTREEIAAAIAQFEAKGKKIQHLAPEVEPGRQELPVSSQIVDFFKITDFSDGWVGHKSLGHTFAVSPYYNP